MTIHSANIFVTYDDDGGDVYWSAASCEMYALANHFMLQVVPAKRRAGETLQ
jgi:hypothetical protein